jgi:hypothetical protein
LDADELSGLAAIGLWALALCRSSHQLTDGALSRRTVRALAPEHGERLADELLRVGLLEVDGDGLVIHDYLVYNPPRESVLSRREKEAKRKADAREAAAAARRARDGAKDTAAPVRADTDADGGEESAAASSLPVPSRPDPLAKQGVCADADAPMTDAVTAVDDERLTETVTILRAASSLHFDLELMGVANVLAMYPPPAEHVKAAHMAVSRAADPTYRTTSAARALEFAFSDLSKRERQLDGIRTAGGKPTEKPAKPWSGALHKALEEQQARRAS